MDYRPSTIDYGLPNTRYQILTTRYSKGLDFIPRKWRKLINNEECIINNETVVDDSLCLYPTNEKIKVIKK